MVLKESDKNDNVDRRSISDTAEEPLYVRVLLLIFRT